MQVAIRELTTVVTFAQALQIVRRWGNRKFWVPRRIDEQSPLALTLGLECAQRLVNAYGGNCLELPSERNALRQMRDQAIWTACEVQRASPSQVALEFGMSRQNVQAVLARMREQRRPRSR